MSDPVKIVPSRLYGDGHYELHVEYSNPTSVTQLDRTQLQQVRDQANAILEAGRNRCEECGEEVVWSSANQGYRHAAPQVTWTHQAKYTAPVTRLADPSRWDPA